MSQEEDWLGMFHLSKHSRNCAAGSEAQRAKRGSAGHQGCCPVSACFSTLCVEAMRMCQEDE